MNQAPVRERATAGKRKQSFRDNTDDGEARPGVNTSSLFPFLGIQIQSQQSFSLIHTDGQRIPYSTSLQADATNRKAQDIVWWWQKLQVYRSFRFPPQLIVKNSSNSKYMTLDENGTAVGAQLQCVL